MKFNHILLIMSMVIISLMVIGVVSASENVSDVIEASDFDEVVTVQNSDIVSDESENEPIAIDVAEDEIIKEDSSSGSDDRSDVLGLNADDEIIKEGSSSSIDLSRLFNSKGTGVDLAGLLNGSVSGVDLAGLLNGSVAGFDLAGLLNGSGIYLPEIIGGKKEGITGEDLTTYYAKTTKFKVTVWSNTNSLTNSKVVFTINNKKYSSKIGSDGVAVLTLDKLKPGTYYVYSSYNDLSIENKIVIKKSIITKNVSKKYKKAGKFTVKVLNSKGKPQANQKVVIKLKGKTYTTKTKSNGIATFKLPKNLKVGKYTIKTTCKGLTISNKLTVKK